MAQNIRDVVNNTKTLTMTDSAINTLMDFERVIDELDMYSFANWKKGELVEGPIYAGHTSLPNRLSCASLFF